MVYIKILAGDEIASTEAIESPGYVKYQPRNNILVRCPEPQAQGIISKDGSTIYQLQDREMLDGDYSVAVPITMMEYDVIGYDDPEDTDPVVSDEETPVMTRAELTAKVTELEETNAMLMECLLEMSEAVYA